MADRLLINGDIRTIGPALPRTDAILLRDGRVAALRATASRVTPGDLKGRLGLPGFQDGHIHLLNDGTDQVETAQPYEAVTLADVQAARAAHASNWQGEMVWGDGWAVTTLTPFDIIGTAVTRERPRHRGRSAPFYPKKRLTVPQAVLGYTRAAAACWHGTCTGQLSPGFAADLIVLDRDRLTCDPYLVAETQVPMTCFKAKPSTKPEEPPCATSPDLTARSPTSTTPPLCPSSTPMGWLWATPSCN